MSKLQLDVRREQLPDQLREGLKVVFVGTAAGRRSAELGAYYAHPGNCFWRTLYEVGLTPREIEPHEYRELLKLGIGFTDIAKMVSGMDHEIHPSEFDRELFGERVQRYRPLAIAFTSKEAARRWLSKPKRQIELGRQKEKTADFPEIFVLSSPSGAARRHWSLNPWQELAKWFRSANADQ